MRTGVQITLYEEEYGVVRRKMPIQGGLRKVQDTAGQGESHRMQVLLGCGKD